MTASGGRLEGAVIASLRRLNLCAEKTAKGATVDIFAFNTDRSIQLGIEVTGTNEAIKKKSNKLTQVMEFERTKADRDKTILLANTHNQTPVDRRPSKNFTNDVVKYLGSHPILLMTGYDLYRLVQDVIAGDKKADDVCTTMYTSNGVFSYS